MIRQAGTNLYGFTYQLFRTFFIESIFALYWLFANACFEVYGLLVSIMLNEIVNYLKQMLL